MFLNTQIKAANTFYQSCEKKNLSNTHGCACLANEILKDWQDVGYQFKIDAVTSIVMKKGVCNAVDKKAYSNKYTKCMTRHAKKHAKNMTKEEFCTCYIDKWSEFVKNFEGDLGKHGAQQSLLSKARGYCINLDRKLAE